VAAALVRLEGAPLDGDKRRRAEALARAHAPSALRWHVTEEPGLVVIRCEAERGFALPLAFVDAGVTVTAEAVAAVEIAARPPPAPPPPAPPPPAPRRVKKEVKRAEPLLPRVVLVLDYSGSMKRTPKGDWGTGDATWHAALVRAVDDLLARAPEAELGLVLYATKILDAVAPAAGNAGELRARIAADLPCPTADSPGCLTSTDHALVRAAELLGAAPGRGRAYVVLVSDGVPSRPGGIASLRPAAERLWRMGATIVTIQVAAGGPESARLRELMVSISGSPDRRGDAGFAFSASSAEELAEVIDGIGFRGTR
jgi:hypothetical protein